MIKRLPRDIIFFLIIPLTIWNMGRGILGDYLAMLLSTTPGFIFSIYTFVKEKQYNISAIFTLTVLFIQTFLNVSAGNAEKMLWYSVLYNAILVLFWSITIFIRRPMMMYFAIDYVYYWGWDRNSSKTLFRTKEIKKGFYILTVLLILRDLTDAILKSFLINKFGIDGFNQIKIIMQIEEWIFTAIIVLGNIFIYKHIMRVKRIQEENKIQVS